MLNNETRELLVKAYNNYTAKELSEIFNIHISSVYRIVKQKRDTGCVKLQTNKRGRKSILTEKDLKNISTCAVGFFNNKGNFRHTDLKVCFQIL